MSAPSHISNQPPFSPDHHDPGEPELFGLSGWKSMLLAGFVAAVVVFMVGAGMDWYVLHENASRNIAISLSDTLAAVIAGVLVVRLLQYERDRRRYLRQRLEIIAEMNHHVRNALQVISMSTYGDQQQLEAVKESVNRIQWALKEILPKM